MIRIIINADDLGKDSQVNDKIAEALQNGFITSSTIMANTELWDKVHTIVSDNPAASFGVHLNLTEGRALTDQPVFRERAVVDEKNCFTKKIRNVNQYDPELQDAVRQEWDAQIKKVVEEEGIVVTHLDGHHHIHADYAFREILSSLTNKWHIKYVRSRYIYPQKGLAMMIRYLVTNISPSFWKKMTDSKKNRLFSVIHSFAETELWRQYMSQQCQMTDYFDSYAHFCNILKEGNSKEDSLVELMCHPGHPNFEEEYGMIKNSLVNINSSIDLISYKFI